MTARRAGICFVVASEITATAFLRDQIRASSAIYETCVAVNTGNLSFLADFAGAAEVVSVPIQRKIAPLADLAALCASFI